MTDALKKVFPAEKYLLEGGEEVTVSPVPFGKLSVFSEAVASLFAKLAESGLTELKDITDLGRVFGVAVEEVMSLMSIVLNKDREWFDTITLADGLGLFNLILAQNFNERSKKNMSALLAKIGSISTS
jgi:hypothetical protein